MEENITYIKDTPIIVIFGVLFISIFGWWLKRRYDRSDFSRESREYGKLLFILDNYELVGAVLIGVVLILIAIFG